MTAASDILQNLEHFNFDLCRVELFEVGFFLSIICLSRFGLVWLGLVLWHINHCWLLMPNLFLYI